MLEQTLKNTRQGSLPGNGYGGFCMAAIQHPSPGSVIMARGVKKIIYNEGQTIGDYGLIYLSEVEPRTWNKNKIRRAKFKCICGNVFVTDVNRAKINRVKSCGCFRAERGRKMCTKHGLSSDRFWYKWCIIKQRVSNPKNIGYKYYGGRGIKLCDEWYNNPKAFIEYCKTLDGWDNKKLTIDRINNDGHYEPGNIRFATMSQQINNRRPYEMWGKT